MMLRHCLIWYSITLKLSKSKYKIRYNFMVSTLIFLYKMFLITVIFTLTV